MIYSDLFLTWLTSLEGFVPYVYDDATGKPAVNGIYKGYPTFGVGHLISSKSDPLYKYTVANPATKAFVYSLLGSDVKKYADTVGSSIKVPLKPFQYDALVSFCYNIGQSGFSGSQVCSLINKGVLSGVQLQNAFNSWIKSKGVVNQTLVDRRKIEFKLFTSGVYTTYNNTPFTVKK